MNRTKKCYQNYLNKWNKILNTKNKIKMKLTWERKMQYTKIGLMIIGLLMFGIFLMK